MKENISSSQMGTVNSKISVVLVTLFSTLSFSNASIFEQYAKTFKNRNDVLGDLAKIYDQFNQIANPDQSLSQFSDMHGEKVQEHSIKLQHSGHQDSDETVSNVKLDTIMEPVLVEDQTNEDPDSLQIERVEDPVFSTKRGHDHLSDDPKLLDSRTLIWGILTQPLIGILKSIDDDSVANFTEFVPAAHVKFIEQTGAKVIPVSYHMERESMYSLLNQINGLYIPGDTQDLLDHHEYQVAFGHIVTYMFKVGHDKNHYFPVFMMGNSLQSFLANRINANPITKSMQINQNMELRLVRETDKTYIFDEITTEDQVDEFIESAKVFNRQRLGLKVRDFNKESRINKRLNIVATFKNPIIPYSSSHSIADEDENIAIIESPDFPLYFITYDVQLTQFVHANVALTDKKDIDPIDRTYHSRSHAQYIARQIGYEGRINKHSFKNKAEIYPRLINNRKLVSVVYSNIEGVSAMPKYLETQDLYLLGKRK